MSAKATKPTSRKAASAKPSTRPRRPRKTVSTAAAGARPGRAKTTRIGVLSDTHGYLDPEILTLFKGVTHIIHAGDVMDREILRRLETVAPVTAVTGNLDGPDVVGELPRETVAEVDGLRFVVGHKPKRLLKRMQRGKVPVEGLDLVVWGHEHVPSAAWIDGRLHLNPGTASAPEEEDDGPTVAIVEKTRNGLSVRFFPLSDRRAAG
jgi:putative phosphoesterase